jgi:hypothetical protein
MNATLDAVGGFNYVPYCDAYGLIDENLKSICLFFKKKIILKIIDRIIFFIVYDFVLI